MKARAENLGVPDLHSLTRPNRTQGSRRGAGAAAGGILGMMVGAAGFAATQVPLWLVLCPFAGILLGMFIGRAFIPRTPHPRSLRKVRPSRRLRESMGERTDNWSL